MLTKLIAAILMAGGAMLAVTQASAQEYDPRYPVCIKLTEWGGGPHIDCSYTSISQCHATASGLAAQCIVNPFYAYERKRER
jgi:hypothetical protein